MLFQKKNIFFNFFPLMYSTQKQLIKEQDDHLNEIGEIAIRLHDHAKNIDQELGKQKEFILKKTLMKIFTIIL